MSVQKWTELATDFTEGEIVSAVKRSVLQKKLDVNAVVNGGMDTVRRESLELAQEATPKRGQRRMKALNALLPPGGRDEATLTDCCLGNESVIGLKNNPNIDRAEGLTPSTPCYVLAPHEEYAILSVERKDDDSPKFLPDVTRLGRIKTCHYVAGLNVFENTLGAFHIQRLRADTQTTAEMWVHQHQQHL
ncbi:hypothetical protein IE81DRAFT_349411 [Ceraceosorus guamensis]|uniref:Uncharacterized protein n=1 Tax=Ceraceosorus guamensis TaxID=1522189 RepID=A0A316VRP3_9BASI|nr:hypothetical protein IE81DRAFT_349411 [Ceraceosorus guamensis]PWN40267.1 hypothetical protein IE81DRAFT_349411 [Ceraceosorus guamensis]